MDRDERQFPLLVFLACSALVLALLLATTVPAILEHRDLRTAERARQQKLESLAHAVRTLRERALALDTDPQAVLVELDRLGLTPADLTPAGATPAGTDPGVAPPASTPSSR